MRPTLRTFLLVLLAVPFAVILLALAPALLPAIGVYGGLLLIFVLLDLFNCAREKDLVIRLIEPSEIAAGATEDLIIELGSATGGSIPDIEIALEVNDILDNSAQNSMTVRAAEGSAAIPLKSLRRGTARISKAWARWQGPIGLTERQIVMEPDLTIPVVPNLKRIFSGLDELQASPGYEFGERNVARRGTGSEFSSLREYSHGMDLRAVDWKRSARKRGLLIKEFEAEQNHQIILAFDTGHLMQEQLGGLSRLDHNVEAGLALSHAALRNGDRVGLFAFDADVNAYVKPVGGMRSFPVLQHYFAGLECSAHETNFTLGLSHLSQQLDRRSLIILFTDFVDATTAELMQENLIHMANRHLVVFVAATDPFLEASALKRIRNSDDIGVAVTAGEMLRERRLLFETLRSRGVFCLEPKENHMIGDLLKQYSTIIRRELI